MNMFCRHLKSAVEAQIDHNRSHKAFKFRRVRRVNIARRRNAFGYAYVTIMVDLRPEFPVAGGKRGALNRTQVRAALDWLAGSARDAYSLRRVARYVYPPFSQSPLPTPLSELSLLPIRCGDGCVVLNALWKGD
jgi:hypothetical protein